MTARDAADLAAIVRCIAKNEPLELTLGVFPDVPEAELRKLLNALATRLEGEAPKSKARKPEPLNDRPTITDLSVYRKGPTPKLPERVIVFTDGASRGNPGPAGAGWVITDPKGKKLAEGHAFLGRRTNNEAEYEAARMALEAAAAGGAKRVELSADSELLVRQLSGQYRVKNERLQELHAAVTAVLTRFDQVDFKHVYREANTAADEQANLAIDEAKRW